MTLSATKNSRKSILVVEDERDIAQLLQLHLTEYCDEVVCENNGHGGLQRAMAHTWDLIILDLRLPGMSGLDICRQLRSSRSYVPILMLTAKSTELDRVLGLELGADDYVTKPFSVQELMARVKAIFRRSDALRLAQKEDALEPLLVAADLTLDVASRKVFRQDLALDLTAREFDLLHYFMQHPGRVFSRVQLLDSVWGYGYEGYEHTVNSHINRLRAKIEPDPAKPSYIQTVWGVGYRFGQ